MYHYIRPNIGYCCIFLSILFGNWYVAAAAAASANPTPAPLPVKQLKFEQRPIRIDVASLESRTVRDHAAVSLTLTIKNLTHSPVNIASLRHRTQSNASQAVLSDNTGHFCTAAESPIGIAQIPHLSNSPKPAAEAMTLLPARSLASVVFEFPGCRISGNRVAFIGEFGLWVDKNVSLVSVPLWGLSLDHSPD